MHRNVLLFFTCLLLSSTEAAPGNGNGGGNGNGNGNGGGNGNGNGGGNGNGNGNGNGGGVVGNNGLSGAATGVSSGKFRFAHPTKKRTDKDNCFIVKLRDGATSDKKQALFNQTEGMEGKVFKHSLHGYVKCGCRLSQLKQLAEDDDIDFIEEDAVIYVDAVQSVSSYWHLDRIDQSNLPLDTFFNYQYTGLGTWVYILDTGVNGAHQEFTGRMGTGVDIIGGGTVDPNTDCQGHGSHCAGLAAGTFAGVAKQATIVSVRVLGCDGGGTSSTVIDGINWVMTQPRGVMSLSLGAGVSSAMNTAVANAVAANYIVVAAAGNSATDACTQSPASAPEAITVASVGRTDTQSSWSNFGTCVDVYAPGESLYSASNTDTTSYVSKSGTSMACPVVAGVAAAYLSGNPSLSATDMQQVIINEATSGVVQSCGTGSPNRLVKSTGVPSLNSRSPSNSPLSQSPSPSPVSASPSPGTPPNTLCSNAIYLPCGTTMAGSTINAAYIASPVTCTTTHTSPEVWYSIYVPATGSVTASLCGGATWDTKLTLWSGTCTDTSLAGLICVIGNDDSCSLQSSLTTTVNAGWYYLMVHGYKSNVGKFNITLTCPAGAVPAPSQSPIAVAAPSPSPNASPSPSPNASPSPSPNASPSPSPNASPSPSPNASPSPSPNASPSPSPNASPSPSPNASPSPSPSPDASLSPSPDASPDPSTSPIVTPDPSPIALPDPSPSPNPSPSPSPNASPSPRASPSPSPKASSSPSPSRKPSSSPSPSRKPSPSPSRIASPSSSPTASPSPSPMVSVSPDISPSISPDASPLPSPYPSTCPPCTCSSTTRNAFDDSVNTHGTHASKTEEGLRNAVYGLIAGMCVLFGFIVGAVVVTCLTWFCVFPKLTAAGLLAVVTDSLDSNSDTLSSSQKVSVDESEVAQKQNLLSREETRNISAAPSHGPSNTRAPSVCFLPPTQSMASWKGARTNSMYDKL